MAAAGSWACGGRTALIRRPPDCVVGDLQAGAAAGDANSEADAAGNHDTEADADTSGSQTADPTPGGDTDRETTRDAGAKPAATTASTANRHRQLPC